MTQATPRDKSAAAPPRPWTWALGPEQIDDDRGGVAVVRDANGVEFLRATTERANAIRVVGCLVEAVNEVEQWRKGGVTEDMLRRHDGSIHLARGCSIVRTEDVAVIRTDEPDSAEVVAFDGQARTITLRFDAMPCAAIGERWLVRPNSRGGGA